MRRPTDGGAEDFWSGLPKPTCSESPMSTLITGCPRIKHRRTGLDMGRANWMTNGNLAVEQVSALPGEMVMQARTHCRACGAHALRPFVSLGRSPLAEALLDAQSVAKPEPHFPLDVGFCTDCTLVQVLQDIPPAQLFVDNYLHFSSFSDTVLTHARTHVTSLIERLKLDEQSLVIEVGSNDGYLLKYFKDAGVHVLGIDPAPRQSAAAAAAGVPVLQDFFDEELASRLRAAGNQADLLIANNVLSRVPDPRGFVAGLATLVTPDGLIVIENTYVRDMIERNEFDTIQHSNLSYLSGHVMHNLMSANGLHLNDVEYFPDLHGGTLRWHCAREERVSSAVRRMLEEERQLGLTGYDYYAGFSDNIDRAVARLRALLRSRRAQGRSIAAYGAAAKGSALLNMAGIGTDLIDFVVDRNPLKQGRYMPGVHIPIRSPHALLDDKPDYVLLLAWNLAEEIKQQQAACLAEGARFIVPVPQPAVIP